MLARLAIAGAITSYQRFVSPYKGFCCAHHALHHRGSCSAFGKKVVLRFGVFRFFALMRLRLLACRSSYRALLAQAEPSRQDGEPAVIDGREYKECPVRPKHLFSKECGYCGVIPFSCW